MKWRSKRKSLLLHLFWCMLIHAYRVQLGCLLQLTYFDEGQPWTTFHQMRLRKQTNKQTIKKTNMTQLAELDWGCHATTIAWRRRLWDSYSSSVIKYTTFSSGYFHSSLFFFIFKNVAQFNRLNFISSYGRKQPPNNGRRTGGEKWVSSHRWEKATGKDLVIVILYCLLIKYILILVYYLLDHFDWKVLGIH